jgi:hypothetical protein
MSDLWKIADLVFKAFPVVAAVIFLTLTSKFVTRDEYLATAEKFSGRLEAVEKLLIKMESAQETNQRQDTELADHESRIRVLEQHR